VVVQGYMCSTWYWCSTVVHCYRCITDVHECKGNIGIQVYHTGTRVVSGYRRNKGVQL